MNIIKDSHIALTATADIQEISKPLYDFFGISNFCYHKLYPEGKEICLSNNLEWAKFVHQNNLTVRADLDTLEMRDYKFFLWPFENKIQKLRDIREIWDCSYGISFITNQNEVFGFAIQSDKDIRIINRYINNIEELERFIQYFAEKAQKLIKQASKDIILQYHKQTDVHADDKINFSPKNFKEKTKITSYQICTEATHELQLTNREIDCLKFLIRGYTTEEAAINLGLSKRTVESHLENIKNKTGTNNKNDLIKLIFSRKIDKYL